MSTNTYKISPKSLPRSQKATGILGAVFVVVVLALIVVHLLVQLDFSLLITHLSGVRVTPAWPQIGLFPTPIH